MKICVFCGSNRGRNPAFVDMAQKLGKEIALRRQTLVYGGGSIGIMGAIANAALAAKGEVIGIMPNFLIEQEIYHPGITQLIRVETMSERKTKMMNLCDAFVVLPGGIGSLEEFFEVFSGSQLSLHNKPIFIFNIDDFYTPILQMIHNVVDEGFAPEVDKGLVIPVQTVEEMYAALPTFTHRVGKKHENLI